MAQITKINFKGGTNYVFIFLVVLGENYIKCKKPTETWLTVDLIMGIN